MSSGRVAGTGTGMYAGARIAGFNALVWVIGLVVAGSVAWFYADEGGFDVEGVGGVDDDYRLAPWEADAPVLATDLGDGRYEGRDGAMISLTGVDVDQPLVLTPEDGTYLLGVWVTGPGGRIVTAGEYGDPPDFDYLSDDSVVVFVTQPDVELWVNGPNDDTWSATLSVGGVPAASEVVSGFESDLFVYDGGASTARLSARGDGDVMITATTIHGTTTVLSAETPLDQSIAWADADRVLFDVEAWGDAGWRIEFPPDVAGTDDPAKDDATPTPGATP
ncbi:hypothetical protein [Microbacterium dauci]|uniref:Uncharacterized protein n=1 Tax=Microbacterium dauci TaxID=3048008 RepID=A0ABT6ZDF9_9MICO|nr:hypothetical protein [Microbacterium sp. LX3-4]MDJ1114016.1 hypothetical protein [Microbacterium sp. LX3-4]